MEERDIGGYSVTYGRDEIQFPVYVLAAAAAICLAAAWATGRVIWLALGIAAAGVTYYNYPLIETGRPTIGANQYGIFIQGFGVIRWSAISGIETVPIANRTLVMNELQIALKQPLGRALVADWREQPFLRSLMRLPWTMTRDNKICVRVDPFSQPPEEIQRTLVRMWRHYRS